ncbi:MAG: hypothetical protein HN994_09545, partial [Candidatus Marinimicrobia bacterium]|nr:hypothetical protein [Candidatus Neomarinimicrobiota bacterium]
MAEAMKLDLTISDTGSESGKSSVPQAFLDLKPTTEEQQEVNPYSKAEYYKN